jgi:UbiD family decarboxylase
MKFKDLRDFVQQLEQRGELKRIQMPISPVLEMTEICVEELKISSIVRHRIRVAERASGESSPFVMAGWSCLPACR